MSMSDTMLAMNGISKRFFGVQALDNVTFECRKGEVHALVGENGAGKSTLMKVLAGAHQPDAGEILLRGEPTRVTDPQHAQRLGISIIYQEFNLIPDLTVMENVFLGREPRSRFGVISTAEMRRRATELFARLSVKIDLNSPVHRLTVAQQQMVEIAKALSLNADVIVMDEPTAPLMGAEIEHLFKIIRDLRAQGVTVIFISHHLDEIFALADRITVLKDGRVVGSVDPGAIDKAGLVRMMVGRTLEEVEAAEHSPEHETVLRVAGLERKGVISGISFSLERGEILGIAGLVGSGRTEVARAIFGADPRDAGDIYLHSIKVRMASPGEAVRRGIGFVTEDRKAEGLVLGLSVKHNISLPNLKRLQQLGFMQRRKERLVTGGIVTGLGVKSAGLDQHVRYLSGGNQQKVILGKWLLADPSVIIFDEPTRGVDVGAKAEIYRLMHQAAARGTGILMISSELPEILRMSDRILVMREGRIVGELSRAEASEERIMLLATGHSMEQVLQTALRQVPEGGAQ
jgi:ribose transport system ATP-binding protein